MNPINGFSPKAPTTKTPMLPKGAYVAGVKGVKIEGTAPDQRIVIALDIIEGEQTGYYTNRFNQESKNSTGKYEVKFKGTYRLQIPNEANQKRQHYDWDLRSFENAIWAFEDSNPGYHWDWNEAGLKGKVIGINVRRGEYNGIEYTTIGRLESANAVREGKVKVMADMKPRFDGQTIGNGSSADGPIIVDEEVPF